MSRSQPPTRRVTPATIPQSRMSTARSRPTSGGQARTVAVTLADGTSFELDHGAVTIAAITSCTNTSNPSVMIGAALVAKKAVERGLNRKPWVKTTLAPGSKVVSDYYDRSGLTPYLDKLGFNLVGYGCTTCIGNSGPLIPEVSAAVHENDLAVVSVLSGNRNFEGRINPDVKMNYLASPPLVVAYAIAGTMDIDLMNDSLGTDEQGNDVHLADIWPSEAEIDEIVSAAIGAEMFTESYADVFAGDEEWQSLPTPEGEIFDWDADSTYVRKPPYFDGMPAEPTPVTDIAGARVLLKLGDSITTDHISPAGSIKAGLARGAIPVRARCGAEGFQLLRVAPRQSRGHDQRNIRQHSPPQPTRTRDRRRIHQRLHRAGRTSRQRCTRRLSITSRLALRWWCWLARSTVRVPHGTGPRRERLCSG